MKNDTMTEIEGLRGIAKAAFAFNDCASEFQGDLTCCQESIDALYTACERYLNDAAVKPTHDASGKRIDGYGDPAKGEYNAFLADDGSDIPCD